MTEKRLEALLHEKAFADSFIMKCVEMQLTITSITFTALAVTAGWLFTQQVKGGTTGAALLIVVALTVFGIGQSVIINALMLHYARYKHFALGAQIAALLDGISPFKSLEALAGPGNPARHLVAAATLLNAVIALVVGSAAIAITWVTQPALERWCVAAAVALAASMALQGWLMYAQAATYREVRAERASNKE